MMLLKIKAEDIVKSDGGNDFINNLIGQTMGKEPYLQFSRQNKSPAQWINALEQQAHIPWLSLLSPMKIQMQKCDKCSLEFCSTISYRRHLRLHRRKLNLDKDLSTKFRGLLQVFWDKLGVEEAMEIISLDDVSLEGVSGTSIIKALTSLIRQPGYPSLPHTYVQSGSVLLDIIQGRPLRFPISSRELFNILDVASENTFLCAGTAESLQKFVFDGDAGKIGLEMRNVIACTSFLIERKLVKECIADNDAESLRHQKLLVEEEEAAWKRNDVLLEKKRQKTLRRKAQRAKELENGEDDDSPEESSPSPPSTIPANDYDSTLEILEIPFDANPSPEPSQLVNVKWDTDKDQENRYPDFVAKQKGYPNLGARQNFEHRALDRGGNWQAANSHWHAPKSHRNPNGFHTNQKPASSRNSHTFANNTKVWTPKPRTVSHEWSSQTNLLVDEPKIMCQEVKLLIGSIPVPLGNHTFNGHDGYIGGASESCASGLSVAGENGACDRPVKDDGNHGSAHLSAIVLCEAVNQHCNEGHAPIDNSGDGSEVGGILHNDSNVVHLTCVVESTSNGCNAQGDLKFSSHVAEAFLSQRWIEAIMGDHVELVLSSEETHGHSDAEDADNEAVLSSKVGECEHNVLCSAENPVPSCTTIDSSAMMKSKVRSKPEKHSKVRCIQKQTSGV